MAYEWEDYSISKKPSRPSQHVVKTTEFRHSCGLYIRDKCAEWMALLEPSKYFKSFRIDLRGPLNRYVDVDRDHFDSTFSLGFRTCAQFTSKIDLVYFFSDPSIPLLALRKFGNSQILIRSFVKFTWFSQICALFLCAPATGLEPNSILPSVPQMLGILMDVPCLEILSITAPDGSPPQ